MVTRHGAAGAAHTPQAAGRTARRVAMFRRRAGAEDGMTLVEVMIALTIMAFGLLALASVSSAGLLSLRDARLRQAAVEAGSSALDGARDLAYQDLVNNSADPHVAASTFDPDDSGCLGAETLVKAVGGTVSGAPFVIGNAVPDPGKLTVRTYVTQVANLKCTASPPPIAARRVTAVVQWLSGSKVHTLRTSTVIAYSQRGVGVPNFDVTPRVQVTVGPPGTQCVAHTVANQGIQDTYEIVATLPTDFALTVYEDANSNGVADLGEELPEYGGVPRTGAVDTFETIDLLFCYEVWDGNRVEIITPRVRSFFDTSVFITLTHTVTTTNQLKFTLHAGDTNAANEIRDVPAPPVPFADQPAWRMDPILPATQGTPALFNEDDPAVDGLAGAIMRRYSVSNPPPLTDPNDWTRPEHLRWDWQAPLGTNVTGAGTFRIWLAPTDALGTPPTNPLTGLPLPYTPKDVAVRFRLWHLDADRNAIALMAESPAVLGVDDKAPHLTWGWQQRLRAFTVLGQHYVQKNHWIRLELACDAVESGQNCHAAMDTNNGALQEYYSYLQLGLL